MKLAKALQAALAAAAVGLVTASPEAANRKLQQQEDILAYSPLTQVTDHAALDLDLLTMENLLNMQTPESMAQAQAIYREGAFSKNYAVLLLNSPLSDDITLSKGTEVSGPAFVNPSVTARGYIMEDVEPGATEVMVQYATSDNQRSYVGCQVGASPNPTLDECFVAEGTMSVGGANDPITYRLDYSYNPLNDNRNGRSLQSLSTNARETMYSCPNCPYSTYQKFFNYYSSFDYGNELIEAAFSGGSTNFGNGNADFSNFESTTSEGVVEFVHKGSVFLNVYMQVIKSMEDACHDCDAGCPLTGCGDDEVNAWDKAVAYFVGSMAKVTNGEEGDFLYNTANKRCRSFGTCTGQSSQASDDIMEEFMMGQRQLFVGNCEAAKRSKDRISDLMAIPLLQGTLRFAYLKDRQGVTDERANALGAVYAASVLPLVHACSPVDSQIVYSNMMIGAVLSPRFDEVKSALERNYRCMGLTCADIGGIVTSAATSSSNRNFAEGGEPCVDSEVDSNEPPQATEEVPVAETEAPTDPQEEVTTEEVSEAPSEGPTNALFEVVAEVPSEAPSDAPSQAPSTFLENFVAAQNSTLTVNVTTTEVTVTTTEVTVTTEPPAATVDAVSVCPPCSSAFGGDAAITPTKTVEECPRLVAAQIQSIPRSCECACFVNSEYSFCAHPEVSYTGTGELVGPCEIGAGSDEEEMKPEEPEEQEDSSPGVVAAPADGPEEYPEEEEKPKPNGDKEVEVEEEGDVLGASNSTSNGEDEIEDDTENEEVNVEDGDRPTVAFAQSNSANSSAAPVFSTVLGGVAVALLMFATVLV